MCCLAQGLSTSSTGHVTNMCSQLNGQDGELLGLAYGVGSKLLWWMRAPTLSQRMANMFEVAFDIRTTRHTQQLDDMEALWGDERLAMVSLFTLCPNTHLICTLVWVQLHIPFKASVRVSNHSNYAHIAQLR
jgi:hypothetical protein